MNQTEAVKAAFNSQKVDPYIAHHFPDGADPSKVHLSCLLRCSTDKLNIEEMVDGVTVLTQVDNIYGIHTTYDKLPQLVAIPEILHFSASRPVILHEEQTKVTPYQDVEVFVL